MSAECGTCGADLVFTTWPEMTCQVCDLTRQLESARSLAVDRDQRLARIREDLSEAQQEMTHGITANTAYIDMMVERALSVAEGREKTT